ncbi:hypothetical protein JCM19992_21350 [Thermostilla marina]
MNESATNHVTGLENGRASYWWEHTYPVGEGTQTDEDSSSVPWNRSYDTTVGYPGFYGAAYYGLDYGGGREEYFAYLGDAFSSGGGTPGSGGGMFPFAYSEEDLLSTQGQGGTQYAMALAGRVDRGGDAQRARPDALREWAPWPPVSGVATSRPVATGQAFRETPSAGSLPGDGSGGAVLMGEAEDGSQEEDGNWWNSSGWLWLNPWSYPILRVPINYYTGYYDALDRAKELEVARQARDPNRIMRAGDIPSLTQGVSQWEAAARAESQIKQFGRDRIADAVYIAGGEIVGMAAEARAAGRVQQLGRGSTANLAKGSKLAETLREQLAIEQALANPKAGKIIGSIEMTDPRWPASEGWVKMTQFIKPGGEPIEVHYLYNTITGAVDDAKIIIRGAR